MRPSLAAMVLVVAACAAPRHGQRDEVVAIRFDGRQAHRLLARQVEFGPRIPGTESHRRTGEWIAAELRAVADEVSVDAFVAAGLPLTNIQARFRPDQQVRVLLGAHWDTRPYANHDPDPRRRREAVLGANDGASGVAVLLELARLFAAKPPRVGVDLVFFDGEDYGDFTNGWADVLLGSQRFAATFSGPVPRWGVLLDMVGDADLCMRREELSYFVHPEVVELLWGVAAELGYGHVFLPGPGNVIVDDHVPLILAGIPMIDIIDLDYEPWHTTGDVVAATSAESLAIVGEVVADAVYREVP